MQGGPRDWSRREWMLAAGAVPLGMKAILSGHDALDLGRDRPRGTPATITPPTSLPDKASFPTLPGTYLDSAGTHPASTGSLDRMKVVANAIANGDLHAARPDQTPIRENFAKLINAQPEEIVFVPSTQIGESYVAFALGVNEPGAHVVTDALHFTGSLEMYMDLSRRGLDVTWVKVKDGGIPLDDLDRAIVKGKTKLVAVSATSLVNGFQHNLKRVCEIAHAKGAMVYADIIQAAGNAPLDVKDAGLDAACCGAYKWLMSPGGVGFLYVNKASQARMIPPVYHFTNYTRIIPATHMYPFDAPGPDVVDDYERKDGAAGMFSTGYDPNPMTLAALEYALPYIMGIGVSNIQAHAQPLIDHLKTELPKRGYPLFTPLEARSPIVAVSVRDADRLAPVFKAANVKITTRWNTMRIAVSVFNDMDDVDRFLAVLPRNA